MKTEQETDYRWHTTRFRGWLVGV